MEGLADESRHAQRKQDGGDSQPYRHQSGGDCAKKDHKDDEGDREAGPFPTPQVGFSQFVIVVGGAGVSHHKHAEAIRAVRLLDDMEDIGDVFHGLLEGTGQHQGHQEGPAVGGDEGRVGEVVVAWQRLHYFGAERSDIGVHLGDFVPEAGVIHG